MLKKMYIKKFIICLCVLFAIFLIYLIPTKTSEEVEIVSKDITTSNIYLLDKNNMLGLTKVITTSTKIKTKAIELLETLTIDGSNQDKIPNGFKAIIPSNTKILSLTYDNNVIKANFSKELLNTTEDMEEKIIEAITYTLTSIDNVDYILIYVENELLTKLPKSKINLPSTLDRSFGINKEYNIDTKDNITSTTIYYINEYEDDLYYVPVTKINNDSRDKIEIIIEELSNNNSNLMSFLNYNTKVINSNIENDTLTINLTNSVFNNIDTKEILDEVIYTISMSIGDNYDVENVIFDVENEEILKSTIKTLE